MEKRCRTVLARLLLAAAPSAGHAASAGPPALEPPAPETLGRARAIVEAMQRSERGPYSRIAWFCRDGSVQPARPYGCAERGGGRQHAVYSDDRRELASLGWPVGTIFAELSWGEFWSDTRQVRMRQLPFERFLIDTEDGWVLRRAQYYRGRVQIEDEEAAGRELLLRLLGQRDWLADNYLLVREVVRTVPHHGGEDRTRALRRASQEIAERDPSFERLRIKIHTAPSAADLTATREWIDQARRRGVDDSILDQAAELARDLETHYSTAGRRERLQAARRVLAGKAGNASIASQLDDVLQLPAAERVQRYAKVMRHVRESVANGASPEAALALIDLSLDLEAELLATAFEALDKPDLARRDLLRLALDLIDAVYGAGVLSARERAALLPPLAAILESTKITTEVYLDATDMLQRAGGWTLGTVRQAFAEPLAGWSALVPGASRFVDDLLRGSPMLPLADVSRRLTLDAQHRAGRMHRIFGRQRAGMLGLNPGVAIGPLRLVDGDGEPDARPGRDEIVVLPETVSDLTPVAGILTLAEGNLLSHVQLLARNLGIPNATLPPRLRSQLESWAGKQVLLAVGGDGSVVLEAVESLPAEATGLTRSVQTTTEPVDAPAPDLSVRKPLPLSELHAGLAGRVVGPKAANLGELARRFPGRVAPAVALPFGVFAQHVTAGSDAPKAQLDRAFERHRAGELSAQVLAAEIEDVRRRVSALRVSDTLRAALTPLLHDLNLSASRGAFIRSDTNVEDLPGFTGAGLNLTVPNVVGIDRIVETIPRVWASPFTERSMAWRERLLRRPEEVYSSVLLMRSVPADKSGVLVTADLATREDGLTVATAWGVGGAVDGDAAETLVLRPDGTEILIAEAKAPYQRRLRDGGGLEWIPAGAGSVLTVDERRQLRELAHEVAVVMPPELGADGTMLPWDVEFGFVDGQLTLFQIRPLIERGSGRADRLIASLAPKRGTRTTSVALDRPVEAPASVTPRRRELEP